MNLLFLYIMCKNNIEYNKYTVDVYICLLYFNWFELVCYVFTIHKDKADWSSTFSKSTTDHKYQTCTVMTINPNIVNHTENLFCLEIVFMLPFNHLQHLNENTVKP